ncbi:nuclear pore complex protein NUP160 isoform X2 [Nymphaea colorata]|uniref:nuclear pore complex protein NUP160 isoform X2 n=1 Tax=Nymphaea colorata TaxID=210225 RepID=UPI00129DFBBC|nr:nuclear pore complex protein NUP160 isoform X2 [Nymphaea colorata]
MSTAAEPAAPVVRFVEVPVIGSDSVQWVDVTVPSSAEDSGEPCAPTTENAAGYAVVGDLPVYLVWRIHKDSPNFLELLELCGSNEFPKCGLRLMFQNALCPFAFICGNKIQGSAGGAYVYVLTVSGFAYLFRLRNLGAYVSGSVFPENDLMVVDLRAQNSQDVKTTRISALPGLLVLGRSDGSVGCFEFGTPVPGSQSSTYELRDVGLSRIWGLVSRTNVSSSVWSLALSEVHGRKLVYVLHADGSMRVWDLNGRLKIFSHNLGLPEIAGYHPIRFWVSDANNDDGEMFIATLYGSESGQEVVVVHGLHISLANKLSLALTSSIRHVVLDKGRLIDLRISCNKLWILKKDGMVFNFFHVELDTGSTYLYSLQEAFVADQLFQVSADSIDDLMYTSCSISSSMKDSSAQVMSSCLLHRLLQPGVYQHAALVASIQNHKHRLTNSVTPVPSDALRKEILSLIEGEGDAANPFSIACSWKRFCSNYFQCWCQNCIPYGLLIDNSTGAVGLIRKNSLSLFRCLEDIEILAYGSFGAFSDFVDIGVNLSDDVLDCEILFKVLKFASYISQHLGEAAAPVLYESLVNPLSISFDDAMSCILKILERGYDLSTTEHYISVFGVDSIWEKKQAQHTKQRKFSINSLLSLTALYNKAGSWTRVLNVVENYVKRLICRKGDVRLAVDAKGLSNVNTSLLAVSVSHFARVMFESACGLLVFLGHICNVQGQVQMSFDDSSKIKLDLIPLIQNILLRWFIVHMLASRPSESVALEDFSYQLSSLHIDNKNDRRLRHDRLGAHNFTVCCILLLEYPSHAEEHSHLTSRSFIGPLTFTRLLQNFVSWVLSGRARDESSFSVSHVIHLAVILIVHNQYEAAESLIVTIDASHKKLISQDIQNGDVEWSVCLYLLGFCLLVRAHCSRIQLLKDQKVHEAVHCFFRAAAVEGAYQAFQRLSFPPNLQCPGASSAVAWKLNYYQWVMQFFEQYNLNEAACQFALAALEQVDEVVQLENQLHSGALPESAATIRGRLWANIFKFNLDLSHYSDAYSAIISNPDEESKHICLRRFIIVLCEHGAFELLCDGELPFVGLMEKVEQELVWKAECSDIMGKPNIYKLLYAIQMHRHNWRRAASFMYRYAVRLKKEKTSKDNSHLSLTLEERLHSLAAAVNALHLVHPAYSWIDSYQESHMPHDQHSPNKKARKSVNEDDVDWQFQQQKSYINIDELENEYVITSAEYLLALANVKITPAGSHSDLDSLLNLLIQTGLYDTAFTVILKFWKGSEMKRQLERVFAEISQCCCSNRSGIHLNSLLLTLSEEGPDNHGALEKGMVPHHTTVHSNWRTLELYLEKYKQLHPRLPVTVAETLLHADPQIELPLWLIHMFKDERKVTSWGMTGSESDPATLFRLFVDYGRYKEAANLLVEYLESFASGRMANILNRKKMSSVWFPYTAIERLWCELQDLKNSGHMVDQCDKLQKLIHGALLGHLKQVKLDSEDACNNGMVKEQGDKVL